MYDSEELTKGLVMDKFHEIIEYSSNQNEYKNGMVWYKEDSYKGTKNSWLAEIFSVATKKQTGKSKGTPDFIVIKENSNVILVVECKASIDNHSKYDNVEDYIINGYGDSNDTQKYGIDGALWYASFLNDKYDVVATAVSGQNKTEARITSFVLPRGKNIEDIRLIEDCDYLKGFKSINEYEENIDTLLGRYDATNEEIEMSLKAYILKCANVLRANGIEDNSKAGFISAIILGLTNEKSQLYQLTEKTISDMKNSKNGKTFKDLLGNNVVSLLKDALYGHGQSGDIDHIEGIWDIDKIPNAKRKSLTQYYDILLAKKELIAEPKGVDGKYFLKADTFLASCVYSVFCNVIQLIEHYHGIDIMGEFYTTFLRYTKGNAKEKGIVLTPKHITNLFCDLAEVFSGEKLTENTKIIDICTGTGAFLISALSRIKENIDAEKISDSEKKQKYKYAQTNSLIGIESDPSMYSLSYANMRFHGDGKSNLYNCSSLLKDSFFSKDKLGYTFDSNGNQIPLAEAIKDFKEIDFGFINPPYSLPEDSEAKKITHQDSDFPEYMRDEKYINERKEILLQKQQTELDFVCSMLYYLKKGGIGIAIVPMSCAGNGDKKLRSELLKYHSLLGVVTMPPKLFFDSHVGTATCIMVFKAHVPHNYENPVFFGRWIDDGFKVIPHNGRKETSEWGKIKKEWLSQLKPGHKPNPKVFVWQKIKGEDECLAEAYIETDYSKLTDKDFENTLKKYALYKYMDENGLLEEE